MTGEAHNLGKIQRDDKILRAMQLRVMGKPWDPIAAELGYKSAASLSRMVRQRMAQEVSESAAELIGLETARLDVALEKAFELMSSDEAKTVKAGIDALVAVSARRSRLLGLDNAELQALEEARRSLSADQGALVVGALERIFNALNLTPEQRAMLPVIVPREVGRVVEEQEMVVIEGEVEDE